MNFDMVFDIQHAYRQVVHAFAYPGEIVSLRQEADRLEAGLPCRAATGAVSYTHLDVYKRQFLCSEDSTYITGQVIAVDGGMVM